MSRTMPIVLDTFIFENDEIYLKNFHIQRAKETFLSLGPSFYKPVIDEIYSQIEKAEKSESNGKIFRLTMPVRQPENFKLETRPLLPSPARLDLRLIAGFLYPNTLNHQYKWTERAHWDAHADLITDTQDILVTDEQGYLLETSRFNLFVFDQLTDTVLTPRLPRHGLKGVFRAAALAAGVVNIPDVGIKKIKTSDLKSAELIENAGRYLIYVGNSVRRIIPAQLA